MRRELFITCASTIAGITLLADRTLHEGIAHAPTHVIAIQPRSDTIVKLADRPRYSGVAQLVEELSIGRETGPSEYLLSRIGAVFPLRNGSLLVLDVAGGGRGTGSITLRQYDTQGRFIRSFGRTGEGPGELLGVPAIGELPDGRIVLHNGQRRRLIIYSATGTLLSDVALGDPTYVGRSPMGPFARAPYLTDTAGFAYRLVPSRAARGNESPTRISSVHVRFRPDGTIVDTIVPPVFPGAPTYDTTLFQVRGGSVTWGLPFWPTAKWTWSPLGHMITGVPTRYAFELRLPIVRAGATPGRPPVWQPGDPVVSVRRNVAPVVPSEAERAVNRSSLEAGLRQYDPTWTWKGPPMPAVKPAYSRIDAGLDGRIWVHVSLPSERRQRPMGSAFDEFHNPPVWDVFEPDGTYIGQVRLPEAVTHVMMRGDHVWGAVTSDAGVPMVKRWRIAWR